MWKEELKDTNEWRRTHLRSRCHRHHNSPPQSDLNHHALFLQYQQCLRKHLKRIFQAKANTRIETNCTYGIGIGRNDNMLWMIFFVAKIRLFNFNSYGRFKRSIGRPRFRRITTARSQRSKIGGRCNGCAHLARSRGVPPHFLSIVLFACVNIVIV